MGGGDATGDFASSKLSGAGAIDVTGALGAAAGIGAGAVLGCGGGACIEGDEAAAAGFCRLAGPRSASRVAGDGVRGREERSERTPILLLLL